MNAVKTASVKMRWDTFTFPVRVGTPVSEHGVLANDANAFGLVMRTVNAEPDANEWLQVMTDGIVDMEEIIAGYGTELTTAAMTAMSGIHVFIGGKRVNPSDESGKIAEIEAELATKVDTDDVANNLTTSEAGMVLDARQGKALKDSLAWHDVTLELNVSADLSDYNEVYVDIALPAGQHLHFYMQKPASGQTRADIGFYYSASANGGDAALWSADGGFKICKPFYGGSELSEVTSIIARAR